VGGTGRRGGGCSGRWHVNFAASGAMATCAGRRRLQGDGAIIAPLPAVETHGHGTTWHVPRGSSAGAGESTEMRCNQDNAFYGAPTNRPPPANRASGDSAVRRRTGGGEEPFGSLGCFLPVFLGRFNDLSVNICGSSFYLARLAKIRQKHDVAVEN
jgi:hypothetical protein